MPNKEGYASEGVVASERNGTSVFMEPFVPKPTKFAPGEVRPANMGKTVGFDKLASDQASYTEPDRGTFTKNAGKLSK